MADTNDILRHRRIAQHAFFRRENNQVSEALVPSSPIHAEASTFGVHASPSSSPNRRRVSPSDVSLPPSSFSDIDLFFLQDSDPLKFINHGRNITCLHQPNDEWFQTNLSLFGMKDLCKTVYIKVNHDILNAFVERWHTETSSFNLPLGEMSITLDDVSCLLHLLLRGKILDHGRIRKEEALELMVDYLGVDLEAAMMELEKTRGDHARFEFLKKVYTYELLREEQARGDEE
ncbi:uncharacterized protein LOC127102495 [Lathyrus oleraceus]|uniref:uncharacterized protein LOC127102495 n=1 Tax=Pisum sativum TaxID=3888 RepID=UPI0021D2AD15|nr:uncharacterized protein LOC127102495 [Pisum sativum]